MAWGIRCVCVGQRLSNIRRESDTQYCRRHHQSFAQTQVPLSLNVEL